MSHLPGPPQGFRHHALRYSTDDELVGVLGPFVREGLAAGQPVTVVAGDRTTTRLRAVLGSDERAVRFLPTGDWYGDPGEALAGLEALVDEALEVGAEEVRVVGEVPFDAYGRVQREWLRYESALNDLFATAPVRAVCLYDTRVLPAEVVASAERTHPWLATADGWRASERYAAPSAFLREVTAWERERATLLADVAVGEDLSRVRATLRRHAASQGVTGERTEQFVNAANEVVTNAVTHGEQPVRLRVLADDEALMCEVSDHGAGVDDPLAAYRPPAASEEREDGRGLWLARQLCDVVELESRPGGFAVHLAMSVDGVSRSVSA